MVHLAFDSRCLNRVVQIFPVDVAMKKTNYC